MANDQHLCERNTHVCHRTGLLLHMVENSVGYLLSFTVPTLMFLAEAAKVSVWEDTTKMTLNATGWWLPLSLPNSNN